MGSICGLRTLPLSWQDCVAGNHPSPTGMNRIPSPSLAAILLHAVLTAAPFAPAQLSRVISTDIVLPDSPPVVTGYTTQNALGTLTFDAPMVVTSAPGETDRLFVAERAGRLIAVSGLSGTPRKSTFLSLTSLLEEGESLRTNSENGFLSVVFHPQYAANGTLFVYFTIRAPEPQGANDFQRLHRITVANPSASEATIASHEPLLTILDRAGNHNGGDLHFGPDGCLYLSLGDEGGGGDQYDNARYITSQLDPPGTPNRVARTGFWGQLIRIDVDNRPGSLDPNPHAQNSEAYPSAVHSGTYRIPADNPFIGVTSWHNRSFAATDVRTEIWATGLRNPFRFSFDPVDGRLFLGDVGQGTWEEVNIVTRGADLGWSWREGAHRYSSPPPPTMPPGTGFNPVDPIYEYDHTNNGGGNDAVIYGNSITGGAVYRGTRLPGLYGAYVFADYGSGRIAAIRETAPGTWTGERLGSDSGIVDFGYDPRDGDLLFCDLTGGMVKRLVPEVSGTGPPPTLSGVHLFSDTAGLVPNPGVTAYRPAVPSWNDHALTRRWFAVREEGARITYHADQPWQLPARMVWVQHFDLETERGNPATARPLETRILVRTQDDVYGLSYRWRPDGSDADLVPEGGDEATLTVTVNGEPVEQTWRFPARGECRTCHTAAGGYALTFNSWQLNTTHVFGGVEQNQIAALSEAGYFTEPVTGIHHLRPLAPPDDESVSLEWRVRSYLAANCAHCHQPGAPSQGNWDARPGVPTADAGLINGLLVNPLGDPDNRVAVPGDPGHSMILQRIVADGVPRMPPVAIQQADPGGIALLSQWISTALPDRQDFEAWRIAHFGSPLPPESAPDQDPDGDGSDNALEFAAGTPPLLPNPPPAPTVNFSPESLTVTFPVPAGRAAVIETSPSPVEGWVPWDVPGNAPVFRAADAVQSISVPHSGTPGSRFFRARLITP